MSAFVVDSNVMNAFQLERQSAALGDCHLAFEAIFGIGHIALDETGHCKQEWLSCAAGTFPLALEDWIADRLVDQKIWLYPKGDHPKYKAMIGQGLPKKDHKWVVLAATSKARAIISQDIDFIDCAQKCGAAKIKAAVRAKGNGPTAKWVKSETGAEVWLTEDVRAKLAA